MSGREDSKETKSLGKETLVRNDSVLGDLPKKKVLVKCKTMSRSDFIKISAEAAANVSKLMGN